VNILTRHQQYNKKRLKSYAEFYQSPEWKKIRIVVLKRDHFACQLCGVNISRRGSSRVDHIIPLKKNWDLRLETSNLRSLCAPCDNRARIASETEWSRVDEVGVDGFVEGSGW
jgi:5-methylcytosine-specific restriction enzyme A